MESLQKFVNRLCLSVGCYSHPNQSSSLYSLKKYDSNQHLRMGVFGWVQELTREAIFRVSSNKDLGDKAGVSDLADDVRPRWNWEKDGILFYVKPDSDGNDYQKCVRALRAILAIKS